MKKHLLTIVLPLLLAASAVRAQCIPDITITSGIYPDPTVNLPAAYANVFYETSVQFFVPHDTTYNGTYVTLTQFDIDSVTGFPPGFAYSCTPSNCTFPSLTNGCVYLSGTPVLADTGTWYLTIYITATGHLFGWIPITEHTTYSDYKIKVFGPADAAFHAAPVSVCKGGTVIYDNNSSNKPISYQWSFPGGTPAFSTDTNPSVTYNIPGNYDATLIAINPAGSDTLTKINLIHVHDLPDTTFSIIGNDTACGGQTINLQGVYDANNSYQWYRFQIPIAGATGSSYAATQKAWYKLYVINNNDGCENYSVPRKIVIENPSALITPAGPVSFCNPGSVILDAPTANGYSYQWYRNNNSMSGATSSSLTATASGNYKVMVTNSLGCFKMSGPTTVKENPKPDATVSVSGPVTFCDPGNVSFTAPVSSGYNYKWYKNDIFIRGATSSAFTARSSGSFKVKVTDALDCYRFSSPVSVTENPKPTASFSIILSTSFCPGDTVVLQAYQETGYTFQWLRFGISIPGATQANYDATLKGKYRVVVTDANGCSETSAMKQLTYNCRMMGTVDGPSNYDLNVYPNPASNEVFVECTSLLGSTISICIFDETGRLVRSEKTEPDQSGSIKKAISVSGLARGIYQVHVSSENENAFTQLVIE
jgi:PKD repeat protein